jgi:hypothetical protein
MIRGHSKIKTIVNILVFSILLILAVNCIDIHNAKAGAEKLKFSTYHNGFSRKIGQEIFVDQLVTSSWHNDVQKNLLTDAQLQKLNIRIRNIARYLGSSSPAIVTIEDYSVETNGNYLKSIPNFTITDIRDDRGKWVSLSVGQALRLVSQERHIVNNNYLQQSKDFLAFDRSNNIYHPLIGLTLDRYCHALFHQISMNNNSDK